MQIEEYATSTPFGRRIAIARSPVPGYVNVTDRPGSRASAILTAPADPVRRGKMPTATATAPSARPPEIVTRIRR